MDGAAGGEGLGWLHNKRILHGDLKTNNLFVFTGTHEPAIKIGDLGSLLRLDAFGVYSRGYIQRCITSYTYAAPEKLLAGIRKLPHIELGADIFSLGVVLFELFGKQHPLHLFQTSGMQEMQDSRPNHLLPYNPRSPIHEDLQEVLNLSVPYESSKRATALALSQHKGLATGREFVLPRLPNPAEYEAGGG